MVVEEKYYTNAFFQQGVVGDINAFFFNLNKLA